MMNRTLRPAFSLLTALAVLTAGCQQKDHPEPLEGNGTANLTVVSPAFTNGQPIPKKYTGEGEDVSPPLSWKGAPEDTKTFVLICDDPDAPRTEPWVHWILFNIPAGTTSLEENSPTLGTAGGNSWGKTGYGGPMPPAGHGTHHYHFKIYALDRSLSLEPGATKQQVLQALEGRVLAEGELVGTYER